MPEIILGCNAAPVAMAAGRLGSLIALAISLRAILPLPVAPTIACLSIILIPMGRMIAGLYLSAALPA